MNMLEFNNGDLCPVLGLGTWKSAPDAIGAAIGEAIRLGYRHFDCAAIYGNEAEIGTAFAAEFSAENVKREDLWITSKLWNNAHAPADVLPAFKQTLADLQLDYLDLYLMHWPVAFKPGVKWAESAEDMVSLSQIPLAETWAAMEDLVGHGLTRHIGVANFGLPKLKSLVDSAEIAPEMNQIELHPYLQQPKMLEYCKSAKVHLTAYAPLGSGGRPEHLKSDNEPVVMQDGKIATIAERLDVSAAQVMLAWALERGTAVIPKSTDSKHLADNFSAADLKLSTDDIEAINLLDRRRRYFDGEGWAFPEAGYTVESLWERV